jgi:Ankyrin repeats (many copies)
MTEAIAQDPVFQEMAKEMQDAMGGLALGGEGAAAGEAPALGAGGMPPGMPAIDPTKYMQAMERVMQNPEFMTAAESLGRGLMTNAMSPEDKLMLEIFQNPDNQAALKKRMEDLKEDPELTEVMSDIEGGGQEALMKYMNNPEIMAKIGKKFQEALNDPEFRAQLKGAEELNALEAGAAATASPAVDAEEEEEEAEPATPIIAAASAGEADNLKQLIAEKAAGVDDRDEEGRTALHFASGYGEVECMAILLEAGADINGKDNNGNTALHYAAGYGSVEATKVLLEKGADVSIKNEDEKTAVEVATMNEEEECVNLFKGEE